MMNRSELAATNSLSASEFAGWMDDIGCFEPKPIIAVATSGGADSMALLLLAKAWAAKIGGEIISLTVNHNLRKEAASEAMQVATWCRNLGIKHITLDWQPPDNLKSLQENARSARYSLLTNYCRDNNILHLLTAHHTGDQAETLFFRLARGSGMDGLASISAQTIVNGVRVLRPLLAASKAQLLATLKEHGQEWVEDPSNENTLYSRVHIRKQLMGKNSIIEKASELAHSFGRIRNEKYPYLVSWLTDNVKIYPMGYALINNLNIPADVLAAIIQTLNGSEHPPRSQKMESLNFVTKRSLAGLIFEPLGNKIIMYREQKRIETSCMLESGKSILWDKRFRVKCSANQKLVVRALGSDGLKQIRKQIPKQSANMPPDRVLRTIPSLWLLEHVVMVPHMKYMSKEATEQNFQCNVDFKPAKPLAGSGFFINNQVWNFS